jgi:molybdopterin/thiamine biosynthesis adenylyltransferase
MQLFRFQKVHRYNTCNLFFIDSVLNFTCVVVLDNYDREYLIKLNKACREKNIGFIYAGNLGLYGYTFVDFG